MKKTTVLKKLISYLKEDEADLEKIFMLEKQNS